MSFTKTTCPYCGVGCGVIAQSPTAENPTFSVQGDKEHPSNYGRLCSKGSALADTLSTDDRLTTPLINGQAVNWDTATSTIAHKFTQIIEQHGNNAVAFYVSGQLLTEDYYVANKLMKGFIGSGNIDTNSRLCMSSAVASHKRAYGSDTVAGCYEDFEKTDLIILVGSNLAWCHPVLFQRISAAKNAREGSDKPLKIIVIDPRRTATCDIADIHLAIQAGADTWLFNGLLHFLRTNDHLDYNFLENYTQGFSETFNKAKQTAGSIPLVAEKCGLTEEEVIEFYRLFARTEKVVTAYSQGVNQSSYGTDKANSIINCHLATGKIGKVGACPFSITGQPNAMGGREVGGLANQLAAHMDFIPEHLSLVQTFWQSPQIAQQPGLKAVDLFNAAAEGKIKALWIMATNPVVSLPNADIVKKALETCELVIVSECVQQTDTSQYAHILLPAATWGEKDGTVTNSERRISRQRAFLPLHGEARPDWWIISQVAQKMGFRAHFDYQSPADIFREYAALSGYRNYGVRDFDISAVATLTDEDYENLKSFQWPARLGENLNNLRQPNGTERLFSQKRFFTASGKANLIPIVPEGAKLKADVEYPLVLNTGRIRDQWHTMTRTSKAARLMSHLSEPFLEIHPEDAAKHSIRTGQLLKVSSALSVANAQHLLQSQSHLILRAKVTDTQRRGNVFAPIHWNEQFSKNARVGTLIAPFTDNYSGQPEFKHTPVYIEPYHAQWYGFILTQQELKLPDEIEYWSKIRQNEGVWLYELASLKSLGNWTTWVQTHFGESPDWLEFKDVARGRYRGAKMKGERLEFCIFINPTPQLPNRSGLVSLFNKDLSLSERLSLLAGEVGKECSARGDIVCACFGVGKNTIIETIQKQGLTTPKQIGAAIKAGTNCGSCLPELKQLIEQALGKTAA